MSVKVRPINGLVLVAPKDLMPSPSNPRDQLTGIPELAQSIRELGMIQPIIAQRLVDGTLQVVAGHRRRAAAIAIDLPQVPVIVRRDMLPDEELLAMLVENGQRAGLDPIEEARAVRKLIRGGITQAEVAQKVGRAQPWVSGRLALLSLPVEEQEAVRRGDITIKAAQKLGHLEAGTVRPGAKGKGSAQYLSATHDLAPRVRARCLTLKHKNKGSASVGGIGCGSCWESVIRADERQHLTAVSHQNGTCVVCDHRIDDPADENPKESP